MATAKEKHTTYKDGKHQHAEVSQKEPTKKSPDRGHTMHEGEMKYDKGYETSTKNLGKTYPEDKQRGNKYTDLQNAAQSKDQQKLARSKFSKIA